jgi:hypothetical protein
VENDEEVVVVLVDLRALVARADVLVVERVELEVLLEPGAVDRPGALDVDPAKAVALDGLYARLSLRRGLRAVDTRPSRAPETGLRKARQWY